MPNFFSRRILAPNDRFVLNSSFNGLIETIKCSNWITVLSQVAYFIFNVLLSINIASAYPSVDLSVGQSIGVSICLESVVVYCGKTADWIRMPFAMVSMVGRGWVY